MPSRRRILLPLLVSLLTALLQGCAGERDGRCVLLIVIDTIRADRLGCYGYAAIETPALDRLASEGVLYENALTAVPVTLPAIATILTGAYPFQHGLRDNGPMRLNSAWTTLAERFQEQGYATGAFVSAEVISREHQLDQGFAVYEDDFSAPYKAFDPRMVDFSDTRQGVERRADQTIDLALGWLADQAGADVFLFVHLFDPHLPRDPPPPFNADYAGRLYDGEIAFADREIGRLLAGIRELWDPSRCLTIAVGDHGEGLQDHEEELHGFLLFEETMRVPLIVQGLSLPRGARVAAVVRTVDLATTICTALGLAPMRESSGTCLPGLELGDPGGARRCAYLETFRPRLSYGWCELHGLRTADWKLISGPTRELYDLARDPSERDNCVARYPQVRDSLYQLMLAEARAALARGIWPADELQLSEEAREKLLSLGYITPAAPALITDNSLALWHFPPEERGGALGLADPRAALPAYNRRIEAQSKRKAGLAALAAGDASRAVALLRAGEALRPSAPGALALSIALERTGRALEARQIAEDAVRAGLAAPLLLEKVAQYRVEDDDYDTAAEMLRTAVMRFPTAGRLWALRAIVEHDRNRRVPAREYAEQAVAVEPQQPRVHYVLGLIAKLGGDLETARRAWRRYLVMEPGAPERETITAFLED